MRVRIERTRMAMGAGSRCYAYAGYVLAADCPWVDKYSTTTHVLSGPRADYFAFHVATLPAEHWQMDRGWGRYEAFQVHERIARVELLALAKSVFPELSDLVEWPELWIERPDLDETHATRYAERAL